MTRSQVLLSILGVILIIVAFWFLLWQPQREQLAAIETSITEEHAEQARLLSTIDQLRAVRRDAPEIESELTAFDSIIPEGNELPSALRQLQLAADEAGVVLQTVSTGRPELVPESVEAGSVETENVGGLSSIPLTAQVVGEYFQVVDFLRRIEDPEITPRGIEWGTATLSPTDYPELNVSLTGSLFAVITAPPPPPGAEDAAPGAVDPDATAPDATDPDATAPDTGGEPIDSDDNEVEVDDTDVVVELDDEEAR